jgi:putative membrane protein
MMWGWCDGAVGVWGWLWSLIPIALLIALVVWIVSALRPRETGPRISSEDSALRILRERFARGEIDRDELESRKRELGG